MTHSSKQISLLSLHVTSRKNLMVLYIASEKPKHFFLFSQNLWVAEPFSLTPDVHFRSFCHVHQLPDSLKNENSYLYLSQHKYHFLKKNLAFLELLMHFWFLTKNFYNLLGLWIFLTKRIRLYSSNCINIHEKIQGILLVVILQLVKLHHKNLLTSPNKWLNKYLILHILEDVRLAFSLLL